MAGSGDGREWDEALAALAHEQWSGWMDYLFSKCVDGEEVREGDLAGAVLIPAWAVERWTRQTGTPYAELPEEEKESDRVEARKVEAAVGDELSRLREENGRLRGENRRLVENANWLRGRIVRGSKALDAVQEMIGEMRIARSVEEKALARPTDPGGASEARGDGGEEG